jgi:hypothetical protein
MFPRGEHITKKRSTLSVTKKSVIQGTGNGPTRKQDNILNISTAYNELF